MLRSLYNNHCVNDNPCPNVDCFPRTDIETIHSYLDTYDSLFLGVKDSAVKVLQLGGVGPVVTSSQGNFYYYGGDVTLLKDYFTKAQIFAVESYQVEDIWDKLHNDPKITLFAGVVDSDPAFVSANLASHSFDVIITDGAPEVGDLSVTLSTYLPLLSEKGIMVLESVQKWGDIEVLMAVVPDNLKSKVQIVDLRDVKGRYDDVLFIVNKSV